MTAGSDSIDQALQSVGDDWRSTRAPATVAGDALWTRLNVSRSRHLATTRLAMAASLFVAVTAVLLIAVQDNQSRPMTLRSVSIPTGTPSSSGLRTPGRMIAPTIPDSPKRAGDVIAPKETRENNDAMETDDVA
ncbi:MAG: hypothetical protein AAF578_12925 [Pseudomonadota bacterium]